MNRIFIAGKISSDIEDITTRSHIQGKRFDHATQQDDETVIYQVSFWGANGVKLLDNMERGFSIFVEGKLVRRTYTEKATNTEKILYQIIGSSLMILNQLTDVKNPSSKSFDLGSEFDDSEFPFQ